MEQSLLNRINYLANKAKSTGLSPKEAEERDKLRKEYLKNFRKNMINMMDKVYIKETDGSIKKVERKNSN